jgi:hypothetical protein
MRAKSDSPSPAQRQYKRARQKANSYQFFATPSALFHTALFTEMASSARSIPVANVRCNRATESEE